MTADNVTSSRLRELSRLASPAPWEAEEESGRMYVYDREGYHLAQIDTDAGPNAALLVALRNDAEKYADLRDAVEAYKKATDMRETLAAENNRSEYAVACVNETNAYNAMLAALAALGGE